MKNFLHMLIQILNKHQILEEPHGRGFCISHSSQKNYLTVSAKSSESQTKINSQGKAR